jgi:hypothetical protein
MNTPAPIAVVAALRERIRCLEGRTRHGRAILPFGIKAIDGCLPEGGLALGALHEVAGGGNGAIDSAAAALFAAVIAARTRGRVLWCVTRQDLFAPALAAAGLAPDRVIYVEAGDEKSVLACFEEGLRHGGSHGGLHTGLGAVVAEVARLSMTASRRLQLAAEGSGAIGIAIRRFPYMRGRGTGVGVSFPALASLNGVIARESGRSSNPQQVGRNASLGVTGCPAFNRSRPWPTSAAIKRAKSETSDFAGHDTKNGIASGFSQPTAAVTRWRVSTLPSHPLPVPGIGRARWRLELIRCRGGESACFEVEACDAQGRLALPSDLVHGSDQKAIGQRRTAR